MCQVGAVWADWMDRAAYRADTKGADMKWEPTQYGCERLVDDNGRILAEVQDSMPRSETSALILGRGHIGAFNTRENAKKAVERTLQQEPT